MLTVLACVRTPDAARAIAVCADRLGVSASVRTATTAVEAIARLAERGADLVFIDGPLTRPDPVGFVRRAIAYSPRATLVVYGLPEPSVATALIQAGARGVIRGGDTDLVTAVTKTVLLLGMTTTPAQMLPAAGVGAGAGGAARGMAAGGLAAHGSGVNGAGVSGAMAAGADGAGRDRRAGAAVAATRPTFATRLNVPGRAGADHPAGGGDPRHADRNGGPSFGPSRGPGSDGEQTSTHANGASSNGAGSNGAAPNGTAPSAAPNGMSPQLVPAQRVDLAVPAVRPPNLTERELQVLHGMADGKSNAEIGRDLFVSEDTVKTHARRLFRKLGARDRAHAVASGFRAGLVG